MQQMHWMSAARGQQQPTHLPQGSSLTSSNTHEAAHLASPSSTTAAVPATSNQPVTPNSTSAAVAAQNVPPSTVHTNAAYNNRYSGHPNNTGGLPMSLQRPPRPAFSSGVSAVPGTGAVSTVSPVAKSNMDAAGAREAPAISGATSAAAHTSSTTAGVFFSGTRTNFTGMTSGGAYNLLNGMSTSVSVGNNNNNSTSGVGGSNFTDANDEEINQLLCELECSVDSPHAAAVMRDVVDAIEARALAHFDPLARDTYLEQRIRDVLTELSRTTNERSLLLAAQLVEALLPIAYTSPQSKFTRLCRSLSVLMQCGNEKAAREAQRVFTLLLTADLHFPSTEAPLKAFLPKELRENCDQALLQLHGRAQLTKAAFPSQFFSIMLFCAATVQVNPRYFSGLVRAQAVQLATTLSGSPDPLLRKVAYECLVAIFSHSSNVRANEMVLENRRLCDECLRTLNASQHNEGHVVSALKALRALLSSRGLAAIDKQVLPQLCVLVTEQQRVSKSPLVRGAVCDLVPIIAPVDIASAPRRSTYCAIIMEPVKNVRDERFKPKELQNVAAFVQSVTYRVFDATNRTNLESILHRYISRPETQEACWSIIAAICAVPARSPSLKSTSSFPNRSITASTAVVVSPTTGVRSLDLSVSESAPDVTLPAAAKQKTNGEAQQSRSSSVSSSSQSETVLSQVSADVPIATVASPTQRSGISLATSPTGPQVAATSNNASINSVHVGNNMDDIILRSLPHVSHAVLTENLVSSLRTIQKFMPLLEADIQAALDRLVDFTLKQITPPPAASVAPHAQQQLQLQQQQQMHHGSFGGVDRRDSSATTTPQTFAHPLGGEVGPRVTPTSSLTSPMGRLTQYFRPSEGSNTTKRDDGTGHLSPTRSYITGKPTGVENSGGGIANAISSVLTGSDGSSGVQSPHYSIPMSMGIHTSPLASHTSSPASMAPPKLKNDLTVALKSFMQRPVTSVQHLDDLKSTVLGFQRHEDPLVRQQSSEAIITSLRQWISYAKEHKTSTYSTRVTEILEAYVKNALLEVDRACRLFEISLLSNATNLRGFLSEQRILSSLLSFLNGTSSIREKTVELLVAITQDPKPSPSVVAVQQSLYVMVESCVVVLEYTNEVRMLIRSMADLQTFTRLCVRPLSSHLGRVFYAFRKRILEDTAPDVVVLSILKTLETILKALSKEEKTVLQYQDDVLELHGPVVSILKQTSSLALSHAAINVLAHMNQMCLPQAYANVQAQQELISSLVHVYIGNSRTMEESLHMLTLFGQLGAIDPSVQPASVAVKKKEEVAVQDEADLELTYDYTVIVYRILSRMLDVSLSDAVCSQALQTLLQFIRYTQDKKDLVGGVHAVRAVLQIAKRTSDNPTLRVEALRVLAAITAMRHERIARLMLPEIVVLLEQLWSPSDYPLFRAVLEVVSALKPGKLSGKEQSESWAWLYPRLVDVALQDRTESREFCLRVVEIVLNASYIPPHCIPVVFPMLLQFVQQSDQLVEVRSQSLCAAVHIVCELQAVQFFSSLLHGIRTLTRHCELNEDLGPRLSTPGVRESLKVLSALHPSGRAIIKLLHDRLGEVKERISGATPGAVYSSVALSSGGVMGLVGGGAASHIGHLSSGTVACMNAISLNSPSASTLVGSPIPSGGVGGGAYLRRNTASEAFSHEEEDAPLTLSAGASSAGGGTLGQEIGLFMKHVEQGFRLKENRLREWFSEFQKQIILVSPHPAFRMMVDLFDKHEPLRRELFLPSFKCLYESLTGEQIKRLNEMLTIILSCSDNELSSKCLGLADYLDHNEPNLKPEVLEVVRSMRRREHHRLNHHSENGSLLVRSATGSAVSVPAMARPRGNASHPPQLSPSQLPCGEAPQPLSQAPDSKAMAGTLNTKTSVANASPVAHNSVSVTAAPSGGGGEDAYDLHSFGDDSSPGPNGERRGARGAQKEHYAISESLILQTEQLELGSFLPVDTVNESTAVEKESRPMPAIASPKHGGDPTTAVGAEMALAGSFRPLVSSIIRRPTQMPANTSAGSSNRSNDYSSDAADVDLSPTGSHIPCQPSMLFSTEDIVRAAEHTRMYDKAFSYLENRLRAMLKLYQYSKMPVEVVHKTVWPLAWLYSQREMQDSVVGLFRAIHYEGGQDKAGFGYELLRWWSKAQQMYAKSITPQSLNDMTVPAHVLEGYVRTLTLCGEWSLALRIAQQVSTRPDVYVSSTVARCGATAAWLLGQWNDVQHLAEFLSTTESHSAAFRLFFLNGAALKSAITEQSPIAYENLRHMLTQSKLVIDESLRTLLPLSYSRAYENLTMLQHFTEMEEMIDYCNCRSSKSRQLMYERWNIRFHNLKPEALLPSLYSLMLYSLVLSTNQMSDMILHFCETMQANYPQLTEWAMNWLRYGSFEQASAKSPSLSPTLLNDSVVSGLGASADSNPNVAVGYITHVWNQGKRNEAVKSMEAFLKKYGKGLEQSNPSCYGNAQLRLGTWKQELFTDLFWKPSFREEQLGHIHCAIRAIPASYEAWHSWGLMNYRIQQRDHGLSPENQRSFVEAAHQGFVGAICRCKDSSEALPAAMRLLQLWVNHNGVELLKETVADSISRIPIDHWVQTIPQLIGHLGNDSHDIREVISMILRSLCEVHPQAVVFPLLVVMMSDAANGSSANASGNVTRGSSEVTVAEDGSPLGSQQQSTPQPPLSDTPIMRKQELVHSIIQHCPKRIFHEAESVAKLLVDVSSIPIEKIRENLSQVATAWNPNAEYEEDREEVHRRLQNTLEIFVANRRHLLFTVGDIGQFVQMVMEDDRNGRRERAASIVSQLVEEISKHVAEKLGREPQKAMEPLLRLRNLSVAVFGEYDIHSRDSYPTIASFSSKLDVIPSKKRPRRIQLNGSDGCLYTYCLKGNEDIRMDERVMQLFGMVNVLLSYTRTSSSAFIHRFPVIPISSNVGLLGWVENANTINNTICNYRATISNVRTHQESNVLRSYVESFGHWDKLSIIQRTEALDFVMNSEQCEAVDVSRAMWHRANTAEQWLDRRTAFTVSLATMSMVGYVLGLGDRHLGNILLSMSTGKIVHIDFGDSFDVGRLRHVLPETVPFRLTRMLTNAMEVFGVDGVFRASATRTQATLHRNRDSIMALLSAFVYDPIMQHKGKMKNVLEKSRSPQDVVERIRNKLRGTEMAIDHRRVTKLNTAPDSCRRPDLLYMSTAFDDDAVRDPSMTLTPEEQVNVLVNEATRIDNYTTLYFGWGPLW